MPGPFTPLPFQTDILNALSNPDIEQVVIVAGVQCGKTQMAKNLLAWHIALDPAPIMLVLPGHKLVKQFSLKRLNPMIRAMPILQEKMLEAATYQENRTTRKMSDSYDAKSFIGGHLRIVSAGSPDSLVSMPMRVVILDELDKAEASKSSGDPEKLAVNRTVSYADRKIVKIGTPAIKETSRLIKAYELSDQRRFLIPCKSCGHAQALTFKQVQFKSAKHRRTSEAKYQCYKCKAQMTQRTLQAQIAKGHWKAQAKSAIAGFHIWSIYSPFISMNDIVDEYLSASKNFDITAMQVFTNEKLAEGWELKGEGLPTNTLMNRAEPYQLRTPPPQVSVLTAGVDVQKDRLEVVVIGWGYQANVGQQWWVVDYNVIYAPPTTQDSWTSLSRYLFQKFGHKTIKAISVDTGGLWTQTVYEFCRQHQHRYVRAVKGAIKKTGPIIARPTQQDIDYRGQKIKGGVQLWGLNTYQLKNILYQSLSKPPDQPGAWHFSHELPPVFYDQLTAERLVDKKHTGDLVWVCPPGRRNEVLDCTVYAIAAGYTIGLDKIAPHIWKKHANKSAQPTPTKTEPTDTNTSIQKQTGWQSIR